MNKYSVLLAGLVLAAFATSVQASVFTDRITFDGGEDTLKDESVGATADGDLSFGVGDIIFGFMRISNIEASGVGDQSIGEQIVIAYSAEIASGTGSDVDPFIMAAVDDADAYSLANLLPAGLLPASALAVMDSTIAVILSNPGTGVADNPLNFTGATPEDQMGEFDPADWDYEAAIGFAAGLNQHGSTDFFQVQVTVLAGGTVVLGLEAAGGSFLDHVWGSGVQFDPVSVKRFDGSFSSHDITIDFPQTTFTNIGTDAPWQFNDQARLRINPTPEPASLTAWALGMATIGVFGAARRRRKLKAQQAVA